MYILQGKMYQTMSEASLDAEAFGAILTRRSKRGLERK